MDHLRVNLKKMERYTAAVGISEPYLEKVATFCEYFIEVESKIISNTPVSKYASTYVDEMKTFLPINLKLIAKIKDLSKVVFTGNPMSEQKINDKTRVIQVETMYVERT